jgi:DnaJ-class molecular chaperone
MTTENQRPRCLTCNGKGIVMTHMMEQLEECPSCKGSGEQLKATIGVASSEFVVRALTTANQMIAKSSLDDFRSALDWAQWCRKVAQAGLDSDEGMLELYK